MTRSRIVFMGTPDFAAVSLRALLAACECFDVVGVVTQPDRQAGRGRKSCPSPVKTESLAASVPVATFDKLKRPETLEVLSGWRPDAIVVAAYGRLLPPAVLELPPHGCINVHASLLPRHRGASPVAHAIMAGDLETGVSIMRMDRGLDTGPVYAQESVPVAADDTCGTLTNKLAALGAELLVRTLPTVVAGRLKAVAQEDALATYAPMLFKEAGCLDFRLPAVELARRVRGLSPWPGAYSCCGGVRVQVLRAQPEPASVVAPGAVLEAGGGGVLVGCGEGALRLLEVKPSGRRAMPAAAWVAGRAVVCGDQFVEPVEPDRRLS